jgi:hypothetical protein
MVVGPRLLYTPQAVGTWSVPEQGGAAAAAHALGYAGPYCLPA